MTTDITELAQRVKTEASAIDDTQWYLAKPSEIRSLVEALEKAQTGEKQWREVVDAFCADDADWHKLTNSTNELISLLSQALCKQADRIAELESRTVKLPDRKSEKFWPNYGLEFDSLGYEIAVTEVLAAAGIKWESE